MPRFTHSREYYIRPNAIKVADKHSTAVCYVHTDTHSFTDENGNQTTYVVAFQAKRQKPDHNYRFPQGPKAAEQWIKRYFKDVQDAEAYKAKKKAEAQAKCAEVEIGDIYYTSWGYDQTNVDFYMVTDRTAKTVKYVRIGKALDHNDGAACDFVAPDKTKINAGWIRENEKTARINAWGFTADGHPASKYDGKPVYETAAGWGH